MSNFLFELKEGLAISFNAIKANKIRSILTTLGIVIGVASVVLMSTAINGIDQSFKDGMSSFMGTENLYVDRWSWSGNRPWWELRKRRHIVMEEFDELKRLADLPLAIAPSSFRMMPMSRKDYLISSARVGGTNQDYIKTTNLDFKEGRFFTEIESKSGRKVIVLGYELAEKLFPFGGGLNQFIKVEGKKYKVIGILKKQGSFMMGLFDPDNQSFIPIEAMFKDFQSRRKGNGITIVVRAPSNEMVADVKEEVFGLMRRIRGLKYDEPDDFSINQQEAMLEQVNGVISVIRIGGLFITGLSLFVGAIGIMNIMFVSVKERTREIGIRKAIGAKRKTILGQFITESAFICLIGGLIGLFIAILGGMLIRQSNFPVQIEADVVILAMGISLMTGILSGIAPAYTAAKMDPVDALRYE